MNALYQLEEAVAHDMDKTEQFRVLALLQQAGTRDQLTQQLSTFVKNLNVTTTAKPNILRRLVNGLDKLYVKFWSFKVSRTLVKIFICLEAGLFSGAIIYTVFTNFDETRALLAGQVTYAHLVLLAQLISAIIAAAFAAYGVIRLNGSHDYAFEAFRRATLINIFLTEFFTFLREQFGAIPSFVFNIILLALISYVIYQERRLSHKTIS